MLDYQLVAASFRNSSNTEEREQPVLVGKSVHLNHCSIMTKYFSFCSLHPKLTKMYFVWVTPSGNDNEVSALLLYD